jgi:hypothetical protein
MRRQAARILAQSAAVAQPIWSYARMRALHTIPIFLAGLSLFDTRIVPLIYRQYKRAAQCYVTVSSR